MSNLDQSTDGRFLDGSLTRCPWCGEEPIYVEYHDREWGVPENRDRELFAKLILDGAQAGLSWLTILRKREGYYAAFDGLDPGRMARYDASKIEELIRDSRIIRNRQKIRSAIQNACAFEELREEKGSFSDFLWGFVDGKTIQNRWGRLEDVPAQTRESKAMSRALKERGFSFVGPTICYAFMQAVGMVNDHLVTCHRYRRLGGCY